MIAIGCDVSKGYADVAVFNDAEKRLFPIMKIDDSIKGETKYLELLESIKNDFPDEQIVVAMEVTGGYEANLAGFLNRVKLQFNLKVFVLNPKPIKRFKEMALHFASTDKSSAKVIALFVLKNYPSLKNCHVEDHRLRALKKTVKRVVNVTKEVVREKTQLENILFTVFPEVIPLMREGVSDWLLKVLDQYPIPLKLKRAKCNILKKNQGVTEDKARNIIALAKSSRGIDNHREFISIVKEHVQAVLTSMTKEKAMKKHLNSMFVEYFPNNPLLSINGVGEYSAAVLMAFIGDVNRFSNANKMTAFFGLDPKVQESGDSVKKRRVSKRGVSIVRKILYMDCLSMLKIKGHPIRNFYYRLRGQGREHLYAMTACMRKLLVIIYAILVSGEKFRMDYQDTVKAIQQSKADTLRKKLGNANLHVVSFDTNVPVSKREAKKRKRLAELKNMEKFPNGKYRVKP